MNDKQIIEHQGNNEMPLTVNEMHSQVQLIQQVLATVMKEDTHYGVIPGTSNKPSLLKPGAEKIMATFRLAAEPVVEDLSDKDTARYRVTVRLISPSGRFVGAGIGECSGAEKKYRWRSAICPQEYDETMPDKRREMWKKGWNNSPPQKVQQIMTDPADTANTVLKMAKKRALVDAVLTATAASDIFTQDIEDLPEELRHTGDTGTRGAAATRKQDKPASANAQPIVEKLTEVANSGGWPALQKAWGALTEVERASVGSAFGAIKKIAEGVKK